MICWLPDLMIYDAAKETWNNYEDKLYLVFRHDFIETKPTFNNRSVLHKKYPMEYDREEAFYHVTCQDYNKNNIRYPDMRRCERIRWVKQFILHYDCNKSECENCDGMKYWISQKYKNPRIHILFEKEKYVVVLEDRGDYYLLITAFYVDHSHKMNALIKDYEKARSAMH